MTTPADLQKAYACQWARCVAPSWRWWEFTCAVARDEARDLIDEALGWGNGAFADASWCLEAEKFGCGYAGRMARVYRELLECCSHGTSGLPTTAALDSLVSQLSADTDLSDGELRFMGNPQATDYRVGPGFLMECARELANLRGRWLQERPRFPSWAGMTPREFLGEIVHLQEPLGIVVTPETPGDRRPVRLPVLLVTDAVGLRQRSTYVFWLVVAQVPKSEAGMAAEFMAHPSMAFVERDPLWREAETRVVAELQRLGLWDPAGASYHLQWRLEPMAGKAACELCALHGPSLSGAMLFAAALVCVQADRQRLRPLEPSIPWLWQLADLAAAGPSFLSRVAISTAVDADGSWSRVGGFPGKADGELLALARNRHDHNPSEPFLLVTSAEQNRDVHEWLQRGGTTGVIQYFSVGRFEELVPRLHVTWRRHLERGWQAYWQQMEARMVQLLVPVVGRPGNSSVEAHRIQTLEFLSLFVELSARREGTEQRVRRAAAQQVYEVFREGWAASGITAVPFDDAEQASDANSALLFRSVHRAVNRCADEMALGDRLAGSNEPDHLEAGLSDLEVSLTEDAIGVIRSNWTQLAIRERFRIADSFSDASPDSPLLLVGAAGGGKTTVTLFLLAMLGDARSEQPHAKTRDLLARASRLRNRIPILIRLRDCKSTPWRNGSVEIGKLIARSAGFESVASLPGWGALPFLVIFDGLDELDAREDRCQFLKALAEFHGSSAQCSLLLTTRPDAYALCSDTVREWLPALQVWELQEFDGPQQVEFLTGWIEWRRKGSSATDPGDAVLLPASEARSLLKAMEKRQLAPLTAQPLMITAIAELWWCQRRERGELPDSRSEILRDIIHLILFGWEESKSEGDAGTLTRLLHDHHLEQDHLINVLGCIAWNSVVMPPEIGDVTHFQFDSQLQYLWAEEGPAGRSPKSREAGLFAKELIQILVERTGLLSPKDSRFHRYYAFAHRTYRNFLAGQCWFAPPRKRLKHKLPELEALERPALGTPAELAAHQRGVGHWAIHQVSAAEAVSAEVNRDHWLQALMLGLGGLFDLGQHPPEVAPFIERFLAEARRRVPQRPAFFLIRLLVRLLRDRGLWQVPKIDSLQFVEVTDLSPEQRSRFVDLLKAMLSSDAETKGDRIAVGTLLGSLLPPGDSLETMGFRWCQVGRPGQLEFRFGDGPTAPLRSLRHPVYIGTTPVTVEQYQAFVDAGGYGQIPGGQWAEVWNNEQRLPLNFDTSHPDWGIFTFQCPRHPRVGVSFWEAAAYCRWLTGELRAGRVPVPVPASELAGWEIRLPTEEEWEFAARGSVQDEPPRTDPDWIRVPWGWASIDEVKEESNCFYRVRSTSAVGMGVFPRNVSPWGVEEMVGNTWDWCSDMVEQDVGGQLAARRVMRGGCWRNPAGGCRCAVRDWDPPGSRFSSVGFRLVLAPVPKEKESGAGLP